MSGDVEKSSMSWDDASPYAVTNRQCTWPNCGKLEGISGCPDHGITGTPEQENWSKKGKQLE